MANSYVTYIGTGSQTDYTIPFPYLSRAHVKIFVDGIQAIPSWINGSVVRIDPPPAEGAVVAIKRTTPIDQKLIDFVHGARLGETDLDLVADLALFITQEAREHQEILYGTDEPPTPACYPDGTLYIKYTP